MGFLQKIRFLVQNPKFGINLLKLQEQLRKKRSQGKQLWVFQCDYRGHYPYLKPFLEYGEKYTDVDIYFAVGYSRKDNPTPFLIEQGIPEDHILEPIEYLRLTDWHVYVSPTVWGNFLPRNSDCIKVQIFHTLADKNIQYNNELLKFNTIFANGPVHNELLKKNIFDKYSDHKGKCTVVNSGYAKIDDLFDGTYSVDALKRQLNIPEEDTRPIILYAPNWEVTSALHKYGESVFEQFEKLPFIFLIKLHYVSLFTREDHDAVISSENHSGLQKEWVDWANILEKYKKNENIRVIDGTNLNPWLFLSDIMITDYGGAALEFICTGKPLIYLDCPEFFEMRGHDILENQVRDTGYIIDDPNDLGPTIEAISVHKNDPHSEAREKVRKKLLYNPGKAAENGFEAIYKIVASHQK